MYSRKDELSANGNTNLGKAFCESLQISMPGLVIYCNLLLMILHRPVTTLRKGAHARKSCLLMKVRSKGSLQELT